MEKLIYGEDYKVIDGVIKIKEGVTHIPGRSFQSKCDIYKVEFPSTLISIGPFAFYNCAIKWGLTLPNSVKYIHNNAFSSNYIESVELGENVEYIGEQAFSYNNITSVKCSSEKLKIIDFCAFINNDPLKTITLASNKTFVNQSLSKKVVISPADARSSLNSCSIDDKDKYSYFNGVLTINEGVQEINSFNSLRDCKKVILPSSLLVISRDTFYSLINLEEVVFGENILKIGRDSFKGCSLRKKELILPESLCNLNYSAFMNNTGSKRIIISSNTNLTGEIKPPYIYQIDDTISHEYYINNGARYIDINDLLEEEKAKLKSRNLLPETIMRNSETKKVFTINQAEIMKCSLIKFMLDNDYDEKINIEAVNRILELKEINIFDVHELVDSLFIRKQINTIYLLISYGYNYMNNSMISKAIINSMYDVIEILLLLGADINELDSDGVTPLSLACKKGDLPLVKYLIEKGAAINMIDKWNKKAIDYAIESNKEDIINLINSYDEEKKESEKDLDVIKKQLRLE